MMQTTGERVETARKRLGINQSELATKAEMTPAAISQIENSARMPNAESLKKLSEVLGVSSDWLLTGSTEFTPEWLRKVEETENPEVLVMFRGFPDLSDHEKEILMRVWKSMDKKDGVGK